MKEKIGQVIDRDCIIADSELTLATASCNNYYIVSGFKKCSQKQRLSNIGLGFGALIEIISNIPGKPLIVFVRGTRFAVSRKIASEILVVRHENN